MDYFTSSKTEGKIPYATAVSVPNMDPESQSENTGNISNLSTQEPAEMTPALISQLTQQGFTKGLAMSLRENAMVFPLRVWIIDNSGSMNRVDGHRIVETSTSANLQIVESTRWEEIRECVNYHSQMSSLLNAPTIFRLLNPAARIPNQEFTIAQNGYNPSEASEARSLLSRVSPGGLTPLTKHIHHIRGNIISPMKHQLESTGQKIAIIIATDGLPTDSSGTCSNYSKDEFVTALKSLEGLPVWIVIRLCTDEDDVVEFYNDIDEQLELSIEVLDDFVGEAQEVYEHNKWLNYGLPLHRCRELGFEDRVFDLIDERALTKSEIFQFCRIIFGEEEFDSVPDPSIDLRGFLSEIDRIMESSTQKQWNPITKKVQPWINTRKLQSLYGDAGCGCTIS
eukprot:CAMPEP_0194424404 /NCGR_PEP_ID=MMETSP0176-20130528/23679_1 /TAXON_ID=216777 /ORGANISM="Proboscia alata, Strain PI-D3" /LENGTH=395 /DNA_ID=CAMNT_0039234151 /DNA_START=60 /DNA_END=1247 /DNA_ORIENTATION=-